MTHWVDGLLTLVLAVAVLVVLMMGLITQRLCRLHWKTARTRFLPRDEMTQSVRNMLDQMAPLLLPLGFVYRYSGATEPALVTHNKQWTFSDVYQHADGHTHAVVTPSMVPEHRQPCMVQLVTCFTDGNNWMTVNCYRHNIPFTTPGWQIFDDYLPGLQAMWQGHLARVRSASQEITSDGIEVSRRLRLASEQLVAQLQREGHLTPVGKGDHLRLTWRAALRVGLRAQRGQWRAARALRTAGANLPQEKPAHDASSAEADIQAFQMQQGLRRQNSSGARSKLLVFAISALLFLLVGGLWMSWTFVPVLLAVVAIHEGGHYLAMRLTGYRNVSVFFLPGLGGLATGEKPSATPFEKLFVYLAGPVPGIALALLALWASSTGLFQAPPWFTEFLIVSLAINYLNLLPITPFDGGRVLETFLFARLPAWRFGFAALCCALLFAGGVALQDTVLRVVAVLVAFGLPHQWRLMRTDRALVRDPQAALDEPQAVGRIFAAFQAAPFRSWSFSKRSATAMGLLPELLARRASAAETLVGLAIYGACLLGPIAVAFVAVPQFGAVASLFLPGSDFQPDDVEADAHPSVRPPPEPDWRAQLAKAASLPRDEQLKVYLGAAQQADNTEDRQTAHQHYLAAWQIAKDLPLRDLRRIDALTGLANSTEDNAESHAHLTQVVAELAQPQGGERLKVAQAKEQLAYGNIAATERIALLRDALDLRLAALDLHLAIADTSHHQLFLTQLNLARALDASGDAAGAQTLLQERVQTVPLPNESDRSRLALMGRVARVNMRVDLAWFLIDHGHAADARAVAALALKEVPKIVTMSWQYPRQMALEAALWADLESRQRASLATTWAALDDAHRRGSRGSPKQLQHEVDRALVAQASGDVALHAATRSSIEQALARYSKRGPPALCNPRQSQDWPSWRQRQSEARARIAREMGACKPG